MSDSEEVRKLRELIEEFEQIEDDAACTAAVSQVLRDWPDMHARLRALRQARVNRLRANDGKTWPEIAAIIGGITAARAQQIGQGLRGVKRPDPVNPRGPRKRPKATPPD